MSELRNKMAASENLSASAKTELNALIDDAEFTFNAIVEVKAEIAEELETVDETVITLNTTMDEFIVEHQGERDIQFARFRATENAANIATIAALVVSLAVGAGLAILVTGLFNRQVAETDRVLRSVRVGDFDTRAEIYSTDEIGNAADSVNAMPDLLTELLDRSQKERAELAEAVETLVSTAGSLEVAERAALSAEEGDRAVNETITSMGRIRNNTQETARRIKRLGEASQEISEVVRLIEELADRTTVLALNASIQAAAAGDAGRGFAVVAEEVQRLAERATTEARHIDDLVKNIQTETNEAVVGIDEATKEVVEGSQLAQQAGDSMSQLSGYMNELSGLIQGVAADALAQAGGAPNGNGTHNN